jgi:hypothetical protein
MRKRRNFYDTNIATLNFKEAYINKANTDFVVLITLIFNVV